MSGQAQPQQSEAALYKLGAKVYFENPEEVDFGAFIRIFNQWIREQLVDGHLLIDVHDYRHVQHGPGILLVGHQGNFSVDFGEGRPGLVYYRKQPLGSDLTGNLSRVLATLLTGCQLLQNGESGVEFSTGQVTWFVNDRLLAPGSDEERASFRDAVARVPGLMAGENQETVGHPGDPRERFSLSMDFDGKALDSLLQGLVG